MAGPLKPQYHKVDPELKALQEENARLEKIIGNQAIELDLKQSFYKNRLLILDSKNAIPHPNEGDQYFCSYNCLEIYITKYQDPQAKQNQN